MTNRIRTLKSIETAAEKIVQRPSDEWNMYIIYLLEQIEHKIEYRTVYPPNNDFDGEVLDKVVSDIKRRKAEGKW